MYIENTITLDNDQHQSYVEVDSIITVDDVRQQIDMLDKTEGSRKNIKSGFNKMLQHGFIDCNKLQEQFSSEGFPTLLFDVKAWVSKSGVNKQWPSFLNDIKAAVSNYTFSISEESSFVDTIRFFVHKKIGSHLSDTQVVNEIVNSSLFPSAFDKSNVKATYLSWLKGRDVRCVVDLESKLRFFDDYLNANGVILKKGLFFIAINRNSGQKGKNGVLFLDLPPILLEELEQFSAWKIASKRPQDPPQFLSLNAREKMKCRASNTSCWTLDSDGSCGTKKAVHGFLKAAHTYSVTVLERSDFRFCMFFDADFLDGFIGWFVERDALGAASKMLEWVASEAKDNTYTHHYKIPPKFATFREWSEELKYISLIINESIRSINSNRVAIDGKRNVRFIIDSASPWIVYQEFLSVMKKIVQVKSGSLWCHASYLAFRWMIYAPLRLRNVSMLKWYGVVSERELLKIKSNESKSIGIFQREESGVFGVFVHFSHLKNKGSSSVESIYQEFVGMDDEFSSYVRLRDSELSRLGVESEYWAFGVSNSVKEGVGGRVRPTHVGNELVKISQQALSVMYPDEYNPGVNPHGVRHLSATLYLNDNPDDYVGLSTLLMDKLETVLAVYAKVNNKQSALKIRTWANKRMNNAA